MPRRDFHPTVNEMSSEPILCPPPVLPAVESGNVRTSYRREGDGAPVLLLGRGPGDGNPPPLLRVLAQHFRVFAPRLTPGTPPRSPLAVAAWLHDLLDGLGLDRPALVVDAEFVLATLAFAMSDPERVGRSAILFPSEIGADGAGPTLRDCLREAGHPVLLVGVGDAPLSGRALDEVVRFLAGVDHQNVGSGWNP